MRTITIQIVFYIWIITLLTSKHIYVLCDDVSNQSSKDILLSVSPNYYLSLWNLYNDVNMQVALLLTLYSIDNHDDVCPLLFERFKSTFYMCTYAFVG